MKISYNWLREYLPTDEVTAKMTENPHKTGRHSNFRRVGSGKY